MYQPIYHFRIPFATKGLLKPKLDPNDICIAGTIHYYFSNQVIIKQVLEVERANVRTIDPMLKQTAYWKQLANQQFHQKYFAIYEHQATKIIRHNLSQWEIAKVNRYFKTCQRTIKSQFALLSGANISGAKADGKKSPIRCFDLSGVFNDENLNLTNVFDQYHYRKENDFDLTNVVDIDIEYLLTNQQILPNFNTYFYRANPQLKNPQSISQHQNRFQLPAKQQQFVAMISDEQNQDSLKQTSLYQYQKQVLRSWYCQNVDLIRTQGLLSPKHCQCALKQVVRAHIVDFSYLIKTKQYLAAIDPFNCVLICANCHDQFDHGAKYQNQPINLIHLNAQQIHYLKQSGKNYKMIDQSD